MQSYRKYLKSLIDLAAEMVRLLEQYEFHHKESGSLEFKAYAQMVSLAEVADERLKRYDSGSQRS